MGEVRGREGGEGRGGVVVRGGKTGGQERLRCRIHTKCLYLQGRIQDFRKGGRGGGGPGNC